MADESAALDKIYTATNALLDAQSKMNKDQVDTFAEHADQFKIIIANAKIGVKTKTLALQQLPKYLGRYPESADAALDILIDLFEEGELYRMKAIEGFKMLASDSTTKDPAVISKLVGVLAQLLLSQDEKEVEVVNVALCAALEKDVQATCTTLLEMMSAEPNVRIKAVGFISQELCPRANKLLNHSVDAQNAVATQIKKLMAIATAAEFKMCMKILFSLKIFQNGVEGANELLAMVTGGIDLETDFNASASDKVDLIFIMMTSAMMMFTHGAQPNKLISYICKKVMPKYEALSPAQQLNLLKVIAEISPYMRGHCCREYITTVYPLMMTLLPAEATEETKINYTAVEAVLYSFHQTASRVPGFLHSICGIKINTGQPECKIDEDHSEKLADLQKRLTVVQAQCKDFVGKLKVVAKKLDEATPEDTPEAKKELAGKQDACRNSTYTCEHVSALCEKLKAQPPKFMAENQARQLSWKVKHNGGKKGGGGGGGGGGGKGGGGAKLSGQKRGRDEQQPAFTGTCNKCGKVGHKAVDCRSGGQGGGQGKKQKGQQGQQGRGGGKGGGRGGRGGRR